MSEPRYRREMPEVRLRISMSLDGFVAGPHQSVDNPLGIGGERLHEWVIELAMWRAQHGMPCPSLIQTCGRG